MKRIRKKAIEYQFFKRLKSIQKNKVQAIYNIVGNLETYSNILNFL